MLLPKISGIYPLVAVTKPVVTIKNVSSHCHVFPEAQLFPVENDYSTLLGLISFKREMQTKLDNSEYTCMLCVNKGPRTHENGGQENLSIMLASSRSQSNSAP
jgi:hypothetical protein